tara:strand:+ start:40520 stop:40858 length:339 start_codon:yes stop_codon:yes gene_type:complete
MYDYIHIGTTPAEEDCTQVVKGQACDYLPKQTQECRMFVAQLKRQFGEPPFDARFEIKTFNHDFGPYCEVVCWHRVPDPDESTTDSLEYALKVEGEALSQWDEVAQGELGIY